MSHIGPLNLLSELVFELTHTAIADCTALFFFSLLEGSKSFRSSVDTGHLFRLGKWLTFCQGLSWGGENTPGSGSAKFRKRFHFRQACSSGRNVNLRQICAFSSRTPKLECTEAKTSNIFTLNIELSLSFPSIGQKNHSLGTWIVLYFLPQCTVTAVRHQEPDLKSRWSDTGIWKEAVRLH